MKRRSAIRDANFVPVLEWVRRLGQETGSFELAKVVNSEARVPERRRMAWDYVITLSTRPDNRRVDMYVEAKTHVSPQTSLATFVKLKWLPPDGQLLMCAPYISPRVAELCREHNVSYLDGAGNSRIVAPGLFIHVSGHPHRRDSIKTAADPFSRKSSRIVRTLLTHPEKAWQVQQLAKEAGVSLGLTSKVKEALLVEAYLEESDRRLYLRDAEKLLQAWAEQYRPHVKQLQLFSMSRPAETESRLAEWCRANEVAYGLTQLSAAWRYAPMIRYDKCVVYIDRNLETNSSLGTVLGHIEAKEVDTGANCTLWLTDDLAVFIGAKEIDGVNVVSPLQLYLDLKLLAGRGEDAAQEILEKELRPLLSTSRSGAETSSGERHE